MAELINEFLEISKESYEFFEKQAAAYRELHESLLKLQQESLTDPNNETLSLFTNLNLNLNNLMTPSRYLEDTQNDDYILKQKEDYIKNTQKRAKEEREDLNMKNEEIKLAQKDSNLSVSRSGKKRTKNRPTATDSTTIPRNAFLLFSREYKAEVKEREKKKVFLHTLTSLSLLLIK